MLRAERRRRGDLVAVALLVTAILVAAVVLALVSPMANTTSVTAAGPPTTAPPGPPDVPGAVAEVWRAPSAATPVPVVVGPVVVTGDQGTVLGRDPQTGQSRWSYRRPLPLCTVGSGWNSALAVYRNGAYCSEVTALDSGSGQRGAQRNSDVHPAERLLDDGYLVTATGPDYLEVWRSDLVRTLGYGATRADAQPGRQPRPNCRHLAAAVTDGRLAVLERCPNETGDRLTVLRPDGNEAERPEEQFSVLLPSADARLVAASANRAAVLLPNPTRLSIRDDHGGELGSYPLDLPATDLAGDPPGPGVASSDGPRAVLWWTGSRTVALDVADLRPLWSVPNALGPGTLWAGRLVVPVPVGLTVLDADSGAPLRTLRVDRAGWSGPVSLGSLGPVLFEQRGPTLIALR